MYIYILSYFLKNKTYCKNSEFSLIDKCWSRIQCLLLRNLEISIKKSMTLEYLPKTNNAVPN